MVRVITATEESVMAIISTCRPSFRNSHDKVAFVVHASFLACGFVLTATGRPAFADNALTSSSSDEVGIEGWNEVMEDQYAFVYVDPERHNKKVLMKCLVINDKLMVNALSDGAPNISHFQINVDEYVAETDATDYNAQYKNLTKLLTSVRLDFLSDVIILHWISIHESRSYEEAPARGGAGIRPARFAFPPPVSPVGGSYPYPSGEVGMYPSWGGFGGGPMFVGPAVPIFGAPCGPEGFSGLPPVPRFDPYGPPLAPGFVPYGPPPAPGFDPYGPPPVSGFDPYGPPPVPGFDPYGPPPAPGFDPYCPPPAPGFVPYSPPPAPGFDPYGRPPAPGFVP